VLYYKLAKGIMIAIQSSS